MEKHKKPKNERIDVDSLTSSESGVVGVLEIILRRFKILTHVSTILPLYLLASLCLATALLPSVVAFHFIHQWSSSFSQIAQYFFTGFSLALGFYLYGFTLIFVAPLTNVILRAKLKPWRGPYYSLSAIRWYIHNGITYLARYTFLEFVTPTPFNIMFYKMMGMKIGKGVQINTTCISDPSLIELGDKVTVGGSVTIVAHYGAGGFLVIAPVKIGRGVTLGLRSIVMGGVEIGEGSKVLPNSVLLPNTKVPPGEIWGGVPAQKMVFPEE